MFLGEIFQIQATTINGWPDPTQTEPQKIDPTRVKKFWPRPITNKYAWAPKSIKFSYFSLFFLIRLRWIDLSFSM